MNYIKKALSTFRSPALRTMMQWAGCVKRQIVLICLSGILSSLLSLCVTMVTKSLIDSAVGHASDGLWYFGGMLVALVIGERVLSVLTAYIRTKASAKLQMEMQQMVTSRMLSKDYAAIKPFHSGELVNRVFSDVGVVRSGIVNILPSLLRTAVSFIGAAVILITMDWRFVPVLIITALLGLVLTVVFRDPMKRRHRLMQEAEDALYASTQETFSNLRIVKASVSESRAMNQMDDRREKLKKEQLRNGTLSIAMNNGMGSMFDVSWLICQLWGCIRIYQGGFTYGSLAAMIQLVNRIQAPIANAVQLAGQVYGVVSSAERIIDVIGLPDEKDEGDLTSFDRIEMKDVSFRYEDGTETVLLHVNATIQRGDVVALTGISGGGKTSLFQLLLGIYRPTEGAVNFVDGDRSVHASRGTRPLFAYVPQGNMLFSGTLRDNLCRFTDSATEEEIQEAVRAACLEDLVKEIGLDAMLGERGIGLSEGQAQRVAIARAILTRAPILLLDEATSALDEKTEAELLEHIAELKMHRDTTVLLVTHRLSALRICDYRLHIADGVLTKEKTALEGYVKDV